MKLLEFRQIIREEVRNVLNTQKRVRTFESFLNESLNDSEAYRIVVDLLKTLHSFTGKIKFRTEDVNGYYNIVYDDPSGLTEDIFKGLKSHKLWNTGFSPATAKFGGDRINIRFDKTAQDILNIKDFDKKDWSPNKIK